MNDLNLSELKYRVFDFTLQVDIIVGIDSQENSVYKSLVSLGKDAPPLYYGGVSGNINDIYGNIEKLIKISNKVKGKNVLFIRTIDNKDNLDEEINGSINLFQKLITIFSESKVLFLLALSEITRPLLPEGMMYAHVKVQGDGRPNEFSRHVMAKIGLLLKNQQKSTKGKPYTAETIVVRDLSEISITYDTEIAYKIWEKDIPFEIFCNFKKDSKTLVVFGQSALNQDIVQLPVYRRWSWTRRIPYSSIVLNDPTLYLDKTLQAGWFIGTKDINYTEVMTEIIKYFSKLANINFNNIIFIGASAGGFTSLAMSSYIKGSSCIVDVPQTNLLTYKNQGAIDKIAQVSFGVSSIDKLDKAEKERFVISSIFKRNMYIPNIYYLQNINDFSAGHIDTQCGEFVSEVRSLLSKHSKLRSSKVIINRYDRMHLIRGGHFPLSEASTLRHLDKAINEFSKRKFDGTMCLIEKSIGSFENEWVHYNKQSL